ncbi:hypothetical protein KBY80_04385 [Synechococcus sp. JJ3a-Johnson]|uniref:hypothetical protein n=1 Tax=unclassified Synechococcus TaxID=2626047 RepID=UPI0020CD48A5|nr:MULTISPECIES: hypothetical protein [unclassified Synechococcus]MCP9830626.1 hypothetical protein [Synechococcus sp. JJ3a-Johnson]
MVDLDALTALDALQWLRTGEEVSKRFAISAASVSRQSRKCLDLFGLDLQRVDGEWNTLGDSSILLLERRVHQTARWMGRRPGYVLVGAFAVFAGSRGLDSGLVEYCWCAEKLPAYS